METPTGPNRIKEIRLSKGIRTEFEFSTILGVEPVTVQLLEASRQIPNEEDLARLVAVLGVSVEEMFPEDPGETASVNGMAARASSADSAFYAILKGPERLLVSPEEMSWSERLPKRDEPIEVYLSLSCGTQANPHLLLDTVAVCEALGLNFAAAAGPAGCCGAAAWGHGHGEHWAKTKVTRQVAMGTKVNVNWCTNCQVRLTGAAARREREEGVVHPVREMQILSFLEERVRELGDRVPWRTEVHRRVAAEGHPLWSEIHANAQLAESRLLAMVPGVEMVGLYDGFSEESPCVFRNRQPGMPPPPEQPRTPAEVRAKRWLLADTLNAMGADTISCQHQGCHRIWSYYASDRLQVRHAVSVLAEALGCDHPDRYQAAALLADPEQVFEQTRPIWQSWAMPEEEARSLADELVDTRFSGGVTSCGCGGGPACRESLITVDVLSAAVSPVVSGSSAQ
jgi:transcriptional regulator with XRE-family HTH domain